MFCGLFCGPRYGILTDDPRHHASAGGIASLGLSGIVLGLLCQKSVSLLDGRSTPNNGTAWRDSDKQRGFAILANLP
jgi:hypothetical protein